MAEVQTKALFTCTEAGYDAALSIMELYRRNGMQAFFYPRLDAVRGPGVPAPVR